MRGSSDARIPTMDLQLEMIVKAIDTLRLDMQRHFDGVNGRLDRLNGQVGDHAKSIAVLQERTGEMFCADHEATFAQLTADVKALQGRDTPAADRRTAAVTSGGVAGALIVLQGIWHWWSSR